MAIPDFQTMMLPFLRFAQDQAEISTRDVVPFLASYYKLSEEDVSEQIPSGYQSKLNNRISWIFAHLHKAGIIEKTRRGFYKITSRGIELLEQNPEKISIKTLKQFPEYLDFWKPKKSNEIEERLINSPYAIFEKRIKYPTL